MKLSVIVPTIRLERLGRWFTSFQQSYMGDWEMIFVSPYECPRTMMRSGLTWLRDWGNPVRCQQIALSHATGDFIHRGVDDSIYLPGTLNRAVEKLTDDYKMIVSCKYTETNASVDKKHKDFQDMNDPKHYTIGYHNQASIFFVPDDYKLLNFGIVSRRLMLEVGGWDCYFESVAIAELDLAVRLQRGGGKIVLSDEIVLECDWMPGHQGDHGPMHDAFAPDMEKYKAIYNNPACEKRISVPLDNSRQASPIWRRRFDY
jgi:hypothetical protein